MEQEFIRLINKKIKEHYQAIKDLLLNKESYSSEVELKNVSLYFAFLEACLQQPYNRLTSVAVFVMGDDGQLTNRMYPFALLKSEVKEGIGDTFFLAIGLANTLEVSGIDPEFESLCVEQFLGKLRA